MILCDNFLNTIKSFKEKDLSFDRQFYYNFLRINL